MVADGMGGHDAGEVASAIVRDTLKEYSGLPLSESIQRAHRAILTAADNGIGAEGMGSTVVALKHHGETFEVAWVGDSRAYQYSPEHGLQALTTDHSYVQMLLASGAINPADAETHPDKNIITQCLGSQEMDTVKVDTLSRNWQAQQWLLLCSDGLTDELSQTEISAILQRSRSPEQATRELVKAALNAGGRDNVTVQIIAAPKQPKTGFFSALEWVPVFTHNRRLDAAIYSAALLALFALLYWTTF